ncbi:MAG: hypothetical protein DRQ78_04495 [Epsilonproteobacteria bacterium]|nr:MAG: hypothetical protein DRQ78_04495 [Campylobacterota bacterium]
MNWQKYQNELMVLAAAMLMLLAYSYKHNQSSSQIIQAQKTQEAVHTLKHAIALKKVWKNKKTKQKVDKLKILVPAAKLRWNKKSNKLQASFVNLTSLELNKLTTHILNLAVQIQLLDIQKIGAAYKVEFKCNW